MTKERINVLLVEDDEDDVFLTRRLLEKAHVVECKLTWEQTFEGGLEAICSGAFDVGLIDFRLGKHNGLKLLKEARKQGALTPLILLTGRGDHEVDRQALEAGASDYLTKEGLDTETLERSIRYARERARSEREIRRQAALLDEAQDAICAYDLDGSVTYWNQRAEQMTGYSADEVGNVCSGDCLYGVDSETVEHAWKTTLQKGEWSGELKQQTKSGEEIIVQSRWTLVRDATGEPEGVLVLNTDITERKRLETQALRAHRMESVGRLASGIAHDLGNLLVPIQLGVRVLQARHAEDEKSQRTLGMIEKSAGRGSEMVDRVLAFARGVEGERVALQLETTLEEVEQLVEESFPDNITFEKDLPAELPPVRGDATQLQQVLVNLSVNARDAMPDGGCLSITATSVVFEAGDACLTPDADPGEYVRIRVSDTGTGIPSEVIGEVFEPFFSTKSDDGTGLGLSTVYSIIQSHDGFVDVQSEEGVGTCFDVFLPVAGKEIVEDADEHVTEDAPASEEQSKKRDERVLVLDDDASIREAIAGTLESSGYRPLTASSGEEARHLFEDHAVEAVLTDVVLSDTDGLELVRAFKERRPEVPVVVCSGRSDAQMEQAREAGAERFLPKPFDAAALCEALDAVLSSERETA